MIEVERSLFPLQPRVSHVAPMRIGPPAQALTESSQPLCTLEPGGPQGEGQGWGGQGRGLAVEEEEEEERNTRAGGGRRRRAQGALGADIRLLRSGMGLFINLMGLWPSWGLRRGRYGGGS